MTPTSSDSRVSSCHLAFAALALMTALPSAAQSGENAHAPTFSIEAPVVLVPTTVMDRHGSIVTGLRADAFAVSQDNVPQRITSFSEQDIPVSIGVVLDTSGSMRTVLPEAKDTLRAFLDTCNPQDEAFLYTVANRPEKDFGFTQDFNSLLGHLVFTGAGGSTALVDTIYAALLQARHAHNGRKALLVISDGMDNHSRYTIRELTAAAVEADVQIYAVTEFDPPRNKKPIELAEERNGVFFLEELSRKTGGFQITAFGAGDVIQAAEKVGRAMRDEYLIGYVPASSADNGKWHTIKVNLKTSNATAYTRSGFYSK
jgi:Ca-activated chloride channel family protein